jgi:hypothetical protein
VSEQAPLFDATVRIDRLPATGRDLTVSLDEPTRAALAEALSISTIDRFEATLTVAPLRGGIRALGRLVADIVQPSVVTFEPVGQHIDEPIDRVFLPEAQARKPTPGSEIFVDLDDEDFPDHIDGPEVDLSAGHRPLSAGAGRKPRFAGHRRWRRAHQSVRGPRKTQEVHRYRSVERGAGACTDSPMGYVWLPPREAQNGLK